MNIKLYLILSFVAVIATSTFTACAKPAAEAPQKAEITIGILDDYSGPTAGSCTPYREAVQDVIKYINEEKGGISGHPINTIVIDFKMDGALAMAGWERLKNANVPMVISVMAVAVPVVQTAGQEDRIPILSGGGSMDLFFPEEPSFFFVDSPQFYGIWESLCDRIEKDWAKKGKSGSPKVAFDLVSMGRYPIIYGKASKIASEKRGWEYLITKSPLAPADVTTQVLQVKEFGADYIYLMGTDSAGIAWHKDLDRQNFHPVVFGSHALGSEELWRAVGDLALGTSVYQFSVQWTETDVPLVQLAHELNENWHPDVTHRPGHYFRGFADFFAVAEAMERALKKVGYESLNGDAVRDAMETIRDFEPMKMGIGYTWTPADHQGLHGVRWYTWAQGGVLESVTDWDIFEPIPDEMKTDAWWMAE